MQIEIEAGLAVAAAPEDKARRALLDAYIEIARHTRQLPSVAQLVRHADCSIRAIYGRFGSLNHLGIEALDEVLGRHLVKVSDNAREADRQTRIRRQVQAWSSACETWRPLWDVMVRQEDSWPELAERAHQRRQESRERLTAFYAPDLAPLPASTRQTVVFVIDSATDLKVWGTMREREGLSVEQATEIWIETIDRMLPPTPAK